MDALSYALTRVEHSCVETLDPDYTVEERAERRRRASCIEVWVSNGCSGTVSLRDDLTLYARSAFSPIVVTRESLDGYLDSVLAACTIMPTAFLDAPQFLIRSCSNSNRPELWLTNHRALRAPRLHPGPEINVVETSVAELKAAIAI